MTKVLYVEDNPANMMLVRQLLLRYPQYQLLEAETGEIGLDMVRQERPEIVLMDINLPGINGFEALAILQQEGYTDTTKVIALSANALVSQVELGRNAGFDYYLTKPINFTKLIDTLQEIVDNQG